MTPRLRVAVLGGGRSSEHDVSLRSAASVAEALDPARYDVVPITIGRDGVWHDGAGAVVTVTPGGGGPLGVDVVFPALHGPFGEDGTVQGLLEMLDVAYVGSGVLGSSATMDKDVCKAILRGEGIDVARDVVVAPASDRAAVAARVAAELGYPVFVKPARLGSSIGISKVPDAGALDAALDVALAHDSKVLIEEFLGGEELEVSILGNDPAALEASVVGRIGYASEWYDYEAKYGEGGSWLDAPADLPAEVAEAIRATARRAFAATDCRGMARVDFFRSGDRVVLNEINTIPGFTATSYYARMFEASGLPYPELLDRLVALALDHHAAQRALRF